MTESLDSAWIDPLSAPFWAAASEQQLLLQQCVDCRRFQHYPRPFCLACGSDRVQWVKASGLGTIYSVTRNHLEVLPNMPPPYYVALVDLDEGPRLLSNLDGDDDNWSINDRVEITWRERVEGPSLPIFRRAVANPD